LISSNAVSFFRYNIFMSKQKLILIDGNSLVYRAFYALPLTMTTKTGVITNAAYGFTAMLLRLLKNEKPDCVTVAFDKGIVTFRHDIFVDYKAQRSETPDELRHQFGLVKDILESLNIPIFEKEGFEADDVIATIARKSAEEGAEVEVVTGDKDAFQLINENIKVVTTRKGITDIVVYDRQKVIERYGLPPEKMLDMVGLKGDPSDNIPGVPGIGEKTASKLIREFGSLDNLMQHREEVKGPKLKQSLYDFEEQAIASKELATLRYDVPIDFNLQKCVLNFDMEKASQKFIEFDFRTLLGRLEELTGEESTEVTDKVNVKFVNEEGLPGFIELIQKVSEVAIDIIDEGLTIFTGEENYFAGEQVMALLKPIFEDENIKKSSFDLKKASVVLRFKDIVLKGLDFDAGIAAYLLHPGKTIDYRDLAGKYIDMYFPEKKDIITESAQRALICYKIKKHLKDELAKQSLNKVYEEIEMPLLNDLALMEYCGVGVDVGLLKQYSDELQGLIIKLEDDIYRQAGLKFNINSPQQLSEILFKKLMLKPIKKTKTGYSTDSTVLAKLINAHPVIENIINYRELLKLKSTYIDALPLLVNPQTGRLHTTFNQTVTATGRLSSSKPNLQNIPIRTDIGSQIRKAFIPACKDDWLLVADYNQIELRILAYLSGDEKLIEAFEKETDVHTATAKEVFGVTEVTPQMRRAAKAVNFGIVYGISSRGLSEQLNITQMEAQLYIHKYFARYPGIQKFLDEIISVATEKGFVTTMFGRKRPLPELTNPDIRIQNFGKRTAVNTVMQGSAADIIKKAMIELDNRLKEKDLKSHMVLQVHDELILEVPEVEKDIAKEVVRAAMEETVKITPTLKASIHFGKNWLDAK
jgi:DNA polymerase-1